MIDPGRVCLFIPGNLKKFKLDLFERIGRHIEALGGGIIRHDAEALDRLPPDITPIVGCQPETSLLIAKWRATGRNWIYWDRGYARRVFATWLPRGENGGYYRWHVNGYQMRALRTVSDDRWRSLRTPVWPWRGGEGRHILVADPSATYQAFHGIAGWLDRTLAEVRKHTDRPVIVRDKESRVPLDVDCSRSFALVTHGSIAAVEAAIMGLPVFVSPDSAAALIGLTDLSQIESPVYPDREPWLRSLAYCQFNERELVDGTLWRLLE